MNWDFQNVQNPMSLEDLKNTMVNKLEICWESWEEELLLMQKDYLLFLLWEELQGIS